IADRRVRSARGGIDRQAHGDLGARAHPGGAAVGIDVEDDPLALAEGPEDRADEGVGREQVLRAVEVAHDDALVAVGVVGLDHTLHARSLWQGSRGARYLAVYDPDGGRPR